MPWSAWMDDWQDRLGKWWLALPEATSTRLQDCSAFLSGALVGRFEQWWRSLSAGKTALRGSDSTPPRDADEALGCDELVERVSETLPAFPEIPEEGGLQEGAHQLREPLPYPLLPALPRWMLPPGLPHLLPQTLVSGIPLHWAKRATAAKPATAREVSSDVSSDGFNAFESTPMKVEIGEARVPPGWAWALGMALVPPIGVCVGFAITVRMLAVAGAIGRPAVGKRSRRVAGAHE